MASTLGTRSKVLDEDRHVSAQLRDVESRMVSTYGGSTSQGEDHVLRTVADIEARFADARVRTFVPILVERAARSELERTATV